MRSAFGVRRITLELHTQHVTLWIPCSLHLKIPLYTNRVNYVGITRILHCEGVIRRKRGEAPVLSASPRFSIGWRRLTSTPISLA